MEIQLAISLHSDDILYETNNYNHHHHHAHNTNQTYNKCK